MSTTLKTPTLDAMRLVKDRSQEIGNFIEWLGHERGIALAKTHEHEAGCYEKVQNDLGFSSRLCGLREGEAYFFAYDIERLLADYFEIDLDAAEREKRNILEHLSESA